MFLSFAPHLLLFFLSFGFLDRFLSRVEAAAVEEILSSGVVLSLLFRLFSRVRSVFACFSILAHYSQNCLSTIPGNSMKEMGEAVKSDCVQNVSSH